MPHRTDNPLCMANRPDLAWCPCTCDPRKNINESEHVIRLLKILTDKLCGECDRTGSYPGVGSTCTCDSCWANRLADELVKTLEK